MFGLSWWHILLVLVVFVLLFGTGQISGLVGDVAKGLEAPSDYFQMMQPWNPILGSHRNSAQRHVKIVDDHDHVCGVPETPIQRSSGGSVAALSGAISAQIAHAVAVNGFFAGAWAGKVYYGIFAASASPLLFAGVFAALTIPVAMLAAFTGVVADPVQRRLGLHRRRLMKMIDALERALLGDGEWRYSPRDHYVARVVDLAALDQAPDDIAADVHAVALRGDVAARVLRGDRDVVRARLHRHVRLEDVPREHPRRLPVHERGREADVARLVERPPPKHRAAASRARELVLLVVAAGRDRAILLVRQAVADGVVAPGLEAGEAADPLRLREPV